MNGTFAVCSVSGLEDAECKKSPAGIFSNVYHVKAWAIACNGWLIFIDNNRKR